MAKKPSQIVAPKHPGQVLQDGYLKPLGMTVSALSKLLGVPASRMNDIVLGRRGVSADTALRLTRLFGGDAQTWLALQATYDLHIARQAAGTRIELEVTPLGARAES
jgi:antitoxin HigA-1